MNPSESDPISSAHPARVRRRPVHGVLLLDKPPGLSSNQALQKCKWLMRAEKAGHTGTLDPLATGVLPLCFGAATKFSQLQLEADKRYRATVRLGVKTSTGDAEGELIETRPVHQLTDEQLAGVARQFTGRIRQVPPMHSALKRDGKALYEYARAGQQVTRDPREVTVRHLELRRGQDSNELVLVATVSKGTYIRTLGEDIGEAIGCGGHLTCLRRTASGRFDISGCVTLDTLEAMAEHERLASVLPVDSLLLAHKRVTLDAENAGRFLSGLRRRGDWLDSEEVAVYGPPPHPGAAESSSVRTENVDAGPGALAGCLLGTARIRGGELIPVRLLSPLEISQILEREE
jgi:tRNA pseudouridine55 synthase